MKTYKNVTCFQREELSHPDLLEAVKEQLEISYPDLNGENRTVVADLMVREDADVFEANGQFTCDPSEL
jgi:hypothetical protein